MAPGSFDFYVVSVSAISANGGAVTLSDNGSPSDPTDDFVTYTPGTNFAGGDTFQYTAVDEFGLSTMATVFVRVYAPADSNTPPVLDDIGNQTVAAGYAATFIARAVDADLPHDRLAFSLDAGAPPGASIDPATGVFTWTPTAAQVGTNTFTVHVTDRGSLADARSVTITVTPNSLLVVTGDIYGTSPSGFKVSAVFGVLANDNDPEQETLTAVVDEEPNHGTLDLEADGSFEYHPDDGYFGEDFFVYHTEAADGRHSGLAVVQLVVQAEPQPRSAGVARGPSAVPGNSIYRYRIMFPDAVDPDKVRSVLPVSSAPALASYLTIYDYWTMSSQIYGIGADFHFQNHPATVNLSFQFERNGIKWATVPKPVHVVAVVVETPTDAFKAEAIWQSPDPVTVTEEIDGRDTEVIARLVRAANRDAEEAGLTWKAKVTLVGSGPNQSNGVDQITVSFVQHARFTRANVHFPSLNKSLLLDINPNKFYLDGDPANKLAWYYNVPEAVLKGSEATSKTITSRDTPAITFPLVWPADSQNKADTVAYDIDFVLDVAAITKADPDRYFAMATVNWSSYLSGTIKQQDLTWQAIVRSGNVAPDKWNLVLSPRLEETELPKGPEILEAGVGWKSKAD